MQVKRIVAGLLVVKGRAHRHGQFPKECDKITIQSNPFMTPGAY
jgi:hypothetical protein